MTQELVQLDHTELATPTRPMGADEYRDAVAEAGEKAKVLAEVVESCNLYAIISGRKYLTVEAWQTIGVGYGITARIEWTHPLEGGGWEARAVAVDANNVERAAAEAEAGRSDDKPWDSRPAYQQRSMAQTRAVSKSLRSCLSWVVVLAGYAPTPAEEMPREADMIQNSKQQTYPKDGNDTRLITDAQRKRLFAILNQVRAAVPSADLSDEAVKAHMETTFGKTDSKELTRTEYDQVVAWVEDHKPDADAPVDPKEEEDDDHLF